MTDENVQPPTARKHHKHTFVWDIHRVVHPNRTGAAPADEA